MMQKAGHAFSYCETSSKVVRSGIFKRKSGAVSRDFIEWLKFQDLKYLAVPGDADKNPPDFAKNYGERPGLLLTEAGK
jgi:hypothetical protein